MFYDLSLKKANVIFGENIVMIFWLCRVEPKSFCEII